MSLKSGLGLIVVLCGMWSAYRPTAAQEVLPLPPVETAENTAPIDDGRRQATNEVDANSPTHHLTPADVERIVAEYLARRDAERGIIQASAEAPLPEPFNDTAPLPPPAWYEVGSDKRLSAHWNHGLELQSANQDFRVHVGGRTQFDTSFFNGDGYLEQSSADGGIGNLSDSMQFRRARLRIDGLIYEQIDFAFEYEFLNENSVDNTQTPPVANTAPAATDLYVTYMKLPLLGNLRVGNQKNPIGFEHLESSRYLDFIERSFNQDLFYGPFNNGFSPGVMAFNTAYDRRLAWFAGVFAANMNGSTNVFGYGIGNDYCYSLRGTVLPYYDQGGRYLLHLGATYEFRNADDGRVRVRTRGNIRNGPPIPFNAVFADTTSLAAEDQQLLNLEYVCQRGPLLIQSEYCFSQISNVTQLTGVMTPIFRGNVFVHGGYIEALYFLTGEHRNYDQERAAFGRVIPHANAFRVLGRNGRVCQGSGAWQVGIRYDRADLNNAGVNGGTLNALTLGVNWFFNPNMKFQVNWDWTHRGTVMRTSTAGVTTGTANGDVFGLGTRLAIDF